MPTLLLSRRALLVPLIALALVVPSVVRAPAADAGSAANAVVNSINAERKARGLAPLRIRTYLNRYAGRHNRNMGARGRLYHSNLRAVCCGRAVGENVGYGASVASVHAMLMRSPAHRANILNRRYDEIGLGVRRVKGRLWVTQVFRDRR